MEPATQVRGAAAHDVPELARVHVASWRETYRGLMPDDVLDDPGFVGRRERFWTAVLTGPGFERNQVAVAERGGAVIGVAMSGPPADSDADWDTQLYVLYSYASVHGLGAGADLLNAVTGPGTSAGLWVADPNPRAQAFYRKHGFRPDGASKAEDGVREIRMVRRLPADLLTPGPGRRRCRDTGHPAASRTGGSGVVARQFWKASR